jgi:hypothetical protein
MPGPPDNRLLVWGRLDNTAAFSGVSAAIEYTFPLLLGVRDRFFVKLKCRAVVP